MSGSVRRRPFIVPVFIPHAGCPHRCVFCDQNATTGLEQVDFSNDAIRDSISRFLSYRIDNDSHTEISFFGGNFLGLDPALIVRLLSVAAEYVKHRRADGIRFSTRPDTIDNARLDLIAPFPVTTIELGVQSMDDRVLAAARRGHTAEQTARAAELISARHIYRLGLQLMVGLPGDSAHGAIETARTCTAFAPDFVRIYPVLVLRSSPLARWCAQGRYTPLSLDEAVTQAGALYRIFARDDIAVIRMGLQPTEDLNPGATVAAGPFHPAFGELVYAALWLKRFRDHIKQTPPVGGALLLSAHPADLSKVKGQRCGNIRRLLSLPSITQVEVNTNGGVAPGTVLVNGAPCRLSDVSGA